MKRKRASQSWHRRPPLPSLSPTNLPKHVQEPDGADVCSFFIGWEARASVHFFYQPSEQPQVYLGDAKAGGNETEQFQDVLAEQ